MDTSTLVILRETLMHRHPRKWFSVCLSGATPKRSTSRPQARSSSSSSSLSPSRIRLSPPSQWPQPRPSIRVEHALCRKQVMTLRDEGKGVRRETRKEQGRRGGSGGRDRLNRGETGNGRILPGFAYHSINSEQRAGPVSCLSFFVGICR